MKILVCCVKYIEIQIPHLNSMVEGVLYKGEQYIPTDIAGKRDRDLAEYVENVSGVVMINPLLDFLSTLSD